MAASVEYPTSLDEAASVTTSAESTSSADSASRRGFDIVKLFRERDLVRVAAPLVRISRLPFRLLCKKWGADVVYTHMIYADCIVNSPQALASDFSTSSHDSPLVVQFGCKDPVTFTKAAQLLSSDCDAFGLNCGCPKSKHLRRGIGCSLLRTPELVADIVAQCNAVLSKPIEVKIRLRKDVRESVELCRRAEKAGVSWITVHARQVKSNDDDAPNVEGLRLVKESVTVPVVANGAIYSMTAARACQKATGVDGVMAARGLMHNPAMFTGAVACPRECFTDLFDLSAAHPSSGFNVRSLRRVCRMSLLPYGFTKRTLAPLEQCETIDAVRSFVAEQFDRAEHAGKPLCVRATWQDRNAHHFEGAAHSG
mmetsp:Transcript_4067/g.12389  ORF Transcript_4067/g.12389 Transcript_4067/m.12389 type:complete len:368 (+) Transcript_4067:67-1170(+)|eukprot:CAMPEP_0177638952 /NCGR_PEP_ID=MMETSP0447-20121125/5763_1 /TAXON_ID=0 /ORGANISM="Stygamoeba regulata, Strain BSH-02190019" /LENGTH=367 /DNA_ID=CAMNT_0019140949 /DNA_START=51 /DNA_END=1154 /DNA_ORIENTATION=-